MMFCGPVFSKEAKDTYPSWSSVAALKGRYGKSYVTTLRRYVEHGPDHPMVLLVPKQANAPWPDARPSVVGQGA